MRPIELTEEHKDKILEMSKVLFPEYVSIYWNTGKGSRGSSEHIGFGVENKEYKHWTDYNYIHWFEFCLTHLVEKILNPNPDKPSRTIREAFQEFFWFTNLYANNLGGKHPIDYLYDIFKDVTK